MQKSQLEQESNKLLSAIKEQNRKRREQMESLVSRYKEEYDRAYEKQLQPRKVLRKPIDFDSIDEHHQNFMRQVGKRSRIKTESHVPP